MLTWLAEAERRGAALVHINPLIEAGSRRTIVPHEFVDMATFHTTSVGTMKIQVRIGGDMATSSTTPTASTSTEAWWPRRRGRSRFPAAESED